MTFGELRGMFGAYESRWLSQQWPLFDAHTASRFPVHVVVEVTGRDGASERYDKPGFYLLVGLSTAKVDELLKHRDGYSRRLDEAELWEIRQKRSIGSMRGE